MEKRQTRGAQNAVPARACGFKSRLRHQTPRKRPLRASPLTRRDKESGHVIDRRQDRQEERIDQGIKSSELTRREAARLERGQAHVNRMENRALADGTISQGEFTRIERAQNVESRRIYHQKHDLQDRPNR